MQAIMPQRCPCRHWPAPGRCLRFGLRRWRLGSIRHGDVGMWEPFLWLALLVSAWRWLIRRRGARQMAPMPDVGDAPAHAEPVLRPRLDDNGLVTYSMVVPDRPRRSVEARDRAAASRSGVPPIVRATTLARPTSSS